MANEIQIPYGVTAKTLYAIIRNSIGQVWRTDTHVFEAYVTANRANYTISLTEQGSASGFYSGTFSSVISLGIYNITAYVQGGGSPVESDIVAGAESEFNWTGSVVTTLPPNISSLLISGSGHISNVDTLTTYTSNTPQSGDAFALLGTPANTTIAGDLAEIEGAVDLLNPPTIQKNVALSAFEFVLYDSTDHITPKTGRTVTAQHSIDGAALASCTNSVTELSNGIYKIDLSAADLNGNTITLRFSATGADDCLITIITQP